MGAHHDESEAKGVELKLILIIVFWLLLGILISPFGAVILLLLIPIYFVRFTVIILAKLFRPDLGEMYHPFNIALGCELFGKTNPRGNIISTMVIRKNLPEEDLRKCIWDNWIRAIDKSNGQPLYPKFQQYPYQWLGFAFHKHAFDTFNLNNHIFLHKDIGIDKPATEQDIWELNETLLNAPYKPETSPWELHLVHNFVNPKIAPDAKEEMSVLILKSHHSLSDGFGLIQAILDGLCGEKLENLPMPKPKIQKTHPLKKWIRILAAPILLLIEMRLYWSQIFCSSAWKIPDSEKTWHQHISKSEYIPLKTIYEIKDKFEVTFTSVLVSAMSAGVYKSMKSKKESGNSKFGDIKSLLTFSLLPLPLHSRKETLTNNATGILFNTPTTHFPSPVQRLKACYELLEDTKSSVVPIMVPVFGRIGGSFFRPMISAFGKNKFIPLGISNFPGFPIPLKMCGKHILTMDTVVGGQARDSGVAIMVMRYHDQIRISVSTEKAIMSRDEVDSFVKSISEKINLLKEHELNENKIKAE